MGYHAGDIMLVMQTLDRTCGSIAQPTRYGPKPQAIFVAPQRSRDSRAVVDLHTSLHAMEFAHGKLVEDRATMTSNGRNQGENPSARGQVRGINNNGTDVDSGNQHHKKKRDSADTSLPDNPPEAALVNFGDERTGPSQTTACYWPIQPATLQILKNEVAYENS